MRSSKKDEKFKKQDALYTSGVWKEKWYSGRESCGAKVINGLSVNLSRNHYFSCNEKD